MCIASTFPPAGGPGVQRTTKFVRYLPEFGWEPIVLTTHRVTGSLRDETLLAEIPASTVVVRAHTMQPVSGKRSLAHYLIWGALKPTCVPDHGTWWIPWALPAALRLVRERPIRAIYATGGPFSSLILGALIKARTGLPLVLDFRDTWTLDPIRRSLFPFYHRLFEPGERVMHRWTVRQADRVVLVTQAYCDAFNQGFGVSPKFVTIRNGFDPEDFDSAVEPDLAPDKFHVVYTGSTRQHLIAPDVFLIGLALAVAQSTSFRQSIRVSFVGDFDPCWTALVKQLQLEPYVHIAGYLPHPQSVGYLRQADVLLLILRDDPARVPAKLYECLGARRPVLALTVREGESTGLLRQAGVAFWANPEDASDIAAKLMQLGDLWKHGALRVTPDEEFIQTLTRRDLTGQLAHTLDELAP